MQAVTSCFLSASFVCMFTLAFENIGIVNPIIGLLTPIRLINVFRFIYSMSRNIRFLNLIGLPRVLKPDGFNLKTFSKLKNIPT